MRITALTENTSHIENIACEHGLSLYIETQGKRILFDTGQTDLFSVNARKLGIDISSVDICVISHGHYDHGGGLKKFFEINKTAPVYMSRHAFEPHYNGERYIGLDLLLKDNGRIVFTCGNSEIAGGINLLSPEGREKKYDSDSCGLNMMQSGKLLPDDFRHEQFMLVTENKKRILFSGCSHNGILNIAEWFNPDILIGGFHYSKLKMDETLAENARILGKSPAMYYTCHCTGTDRYEFMKPYMKNLAYLSAGETIEI